LDYFVHAALGQEVTAIGHEDCSEVKPGVAGNAAAKVVNITLFSNEKKSAVLILLY
jgi:hypothetical protein